MTRTQSFCFSAAILGLCCLSFAEKLSAADVWPQWRGPNRDGRVEQTDWPTALEQNLTAKFQVPLSDGYSGPIVSADRIFVTETAGKQETVRALDRQSGEQIWQAKWSGSMTVPFFAMANGSWIRSTPALADDRLIVASMEDVLYCLATSDGSVLWQVDFRKEFGTGNQSFGFVCSPLVWNDFVFVQTNAGLIKLNLDDGAVAWRGLNQEGGMMGGAFSSPVVAEIEGVAQLVVQTREKLCGILPDSGKELWAVPVPAFRGMNILTPTVIGNRVFTSTYGGGSFLFEVTSSDSGFAVKELWKNKVEGYMSSPVVHGGNIFLHLRNQRVVCIAADSGETRWTSRPFGKYWSMVANGDQCLALDERGELVLFRLSGESFEVIDRQKVSESPTWAHLAVVDDLVLVRSLKDLQAYRWSAAP